MNFYHQTLVRRLTEWFRNWFACFLSCPLSRCYVRWKGACGVQAATKEIAVWVPGPNGVPVASHVVLKDYRFVSEGWPEQLSAVGTVGHSRRLGLVTGSVPMAELQIIFGVTVKLVTVEDAALEVNNNFLSFAHPPIHSCIQPTNQPTNL